MGAAFVRKAYEDATDQRIEDGSTGVVRRVRIDKFALRAFNRLAYDREISGPLAANTLLDLPKYFTQKKIIRKINLWALRKRFSKIIFGGSADKDVAEDFILFGRSRQLPNSKFDDYNWRGAELAAYSFYDYLKTITVIPSKDIKSGDISFAANHPNQTFHVQRLSKKTCNILVALIGPLSTNESAEDVVCGDHTDTDARQNDVGMILLALFVPWDQLADKFHGYQANLSLFRDLCWQIWEDTSQQFEEHALYVAGNIPQIKKSQIETKLDQDLRRAAKDHAKDIDTIEENTDDDGEEEDERRDEEDLGLSNAQSFENAVELTRIRWREIDATDCLNFSILSHMLHFLRVADDQNTSVSEVLYNMNLVRTDSSISQRLGIRSDISNDTMDLWKGIQKSALNEDQDNTDETGEEQDHFHLNSLSSRIDALSGNLEPVLDDIVLLDETPDRFPLGPLMPNADCKTIFDHIHDRLSLNNLQRLVVEEIMNYIIKNKGRMRLDIDEQLLLYV